MSYHLSLAQSEAGTERMAGFLKSLQPAFFRTKIPNVAELMHLKETTANPGSATIRPNCHLAAMRLTTTSLHLQRHTAGNARPRRSCASHTRRWTGAWYCGADHYQTPFQSHLVEHLLRLTHFPRPRCYEAWRTHLRPLCFEWNPVWLYSRPNPKYEVAHRW